MNHEEKKNEIVIYQPDETIRLEVCLRDETVWLNQEQIASLFGTNKKVFEQAYEAYEFCLKEKGKDDQVFVAGSLYLVGQIKEFIIK